MPLILAHIINHKLILKPKVEKDGTVVFKSIERRYLSADWTSELYAQGKIMCSLKIN